MTTDYCFPGTDVRISVDSMAERCHDLTFCEWGDTDTAHRWRIACDVAERYCTPEPGESAHEVARTVAAALYQLAYLCAFALEEEAEAEADYYHALDCGEAVA
jgi:hypothetical protein